MEIRSSYIKAIRIIGLTTCIGGVGLLLMNAEEMSKEADKQFYNTNIGKRVEEQYLERYSILYQYDSLEQTNSIEKYTNIKEMDSTWKASSKKLIELYHTPEYKEHATLVKKKINKDFINLGIAFGMILGGVIIYKKSFDIEENISSKK